MVIKIFLSNFFPITKNNYYDPSHKVLDKFSLILVGLKRNYAKLTFNNNSTSIQIIINVRFTQLIGVNDFVI